MTQLCVTLALRMPSAWMTALFPGVRCSTMSADSAWTAGIPSRSATAFRSAGPAKMDCRYGLLAPISPTSTSETQPGFAPDVDLRLAMILCAFLQFLMIPRHLPADGHHLHRHYTGCLD